MIPGIHPAHRVSNYNQNRSKVIGLVNYDKPKPKPIHDNGGKKALQILKRTVGRDHITRYKVLWYYTHTNYIARDNNDVSWTQEQHFILNYRHMVEEFQKIQPRRAIDTESGSDIERRIKEKKYVSNYGLNRYERDKKRIVHKAKIKNGWFVKEKGGDE